jgi:dihydrofolate reductase
MSGRRVRYSVAMSADGYIAGPKGEHDWIVMDPDIDFKGLFGSFDTLIMGRKTYEASKGQKGGGMPGITPYVLSRTLQSKDCPGVTVASDAKVAIAKIKSKPGKDIWLFGGGNLFAGLLEQNLVDTVELTIVPVFLGGGIAVVPGLAKNKKLKLVKHRVYEKTGTVSLEYAPVR